MSGNYKVTRRKIGLDLRGGTMDLEDTTINRMDTAVKQTGGQLRSKGLSVDGEPIDEEEKGSD